MQSQKAIFIALMIAFITTTLTGFASAACIGKNFEQPMPVQNVQHPAVTITAPKTVSAGEIVPIHADYAIDVENGGSPSFYWCIQGGELQPVTGSENFASVDLLVPNLEVNGAIRVAVQLADNLGYVDTEVVYIEVLADDGLDTDGDGLPDNWEKAYFGSLDQDDSTDYDGDGISDLDEYLNYLDPTIDDAHLDNDNDGFTNAEEIEAGTDPNDPESHPEIEAVTCDYAVPADYTTIQNAIDAAHDNGGGVVCVASGTYTETIVLENGVWVRSETGDPADVIVQGGGNGNVVDVRNVSEGGLYALTITGSQTNGNHAGIDIGGNDTPTIANCVILGNLHGINNGGAAATVIANNVVFQNDGDGIRTVGNGDAHIYNNIIVENGGEGVSSNGQFTLDLHHNNIWNNGGNRPGNGNGNGQGESIEPGDGNISADPLFVGPGAGDFHLAPSSPCIDTGDPNMEDTDGTRSDMGAYGGNFKVTGKPVDPDEYTAGTFTVGETGQVAIDWIFDGGGYKGELGVFALADMDEFTPNSPEFIAEAVRRALSEDTEEGFVVFSDPVEGARFSGYLGDNHDFNQGPYLGKKTFAMAPGTQFAVFLVPNGTINRVQDNPGNNDPKLRPLFSLASSNADHGLYLGQVADIFGTGNAFAYEDLVFTKSDMDFDDVIFQVDGASGDLPTLQELIDEQGLMDELPEWLETGLGREIKDHVTGRIPGDAERITIEVDAPVIAVVYDPQERYCGMETGSTIPGAELAVDDAGKQTFILPVLDQGRYRVVFTADTAGEGQVAVTRTNGDGETVAENTVTIPVDPETVSHIDIEAGTEIEIPEPEPARAFVNATAGAYGAISPRGRVMMAEDESRTFTIVPEQNCRIVDVIVDGGSVGPVPEYTFDNVTSARTIHAVFEAETVTVTIRTEGDGAGTLSEETQQVPYGSDLVVSATAAEGSEFAGWSGGATGTGDAVLTGITEEMELVATFQRIDQPEPEPETVTVTIRAEGNGNGTLSEQTREVLYGSDLTVTATPAEGSEFAGWSGDAEGTGDAVLTDITEEMELVATFQLLEAPTPPTPEPTPNPQPVPVNNAPMAHAGPDQTVLSGETVTLDASASSDDHGIREYAWEVVSGPALELQDADEVQATFTAPPVDGTEAVLEIRLTVADAEGLRHTDTVFITVVHENAAPLASAGPDQSVQEGETVTLNGSNSHDADDGIAAFLWTQVEGTEVDLSDPTASRPEFTAPVVDADGEALVFELTVADLSGEESTDRTVVNVAYVNDPPTAVVPEPFDVLEGQTVQIDAGDSSDPETSILDFAWRQIGGPDVEIADLSLPVLEFTAPMTDADGTVLRFELTVTDGGGLQASAEAMVNVSWDNEPPVADAGEDYRAQEGGASKKMYASGSNDADGAIVSYHWTQIEGPMVALSDPTAMEPTFVLPPVVDSAETVLVFRLKVTDDRGLEAEDEVTVTVTEAGETGFEDGDPVFRTEDGSFLRISTTEPGSLVDLVNIPVPADAEGTAVLPYGLMEVEIKCDVPGDPVNLTLTLPEPASPEMAFLSMQADGAWAELADRAAFTEDGTGITLTLVDGGFGDRDGMENGRILLQAAPGEMTSADTDSTVDEDTGGSGGACFIAGMAASGSFPLVLFLGVGGILFGSMKLGRKRK